MRQRRYNHVSCDLGVGAHNLQWRLKYLMNDVNLIFSHCSLMHVMLKRTRWQINQGEYTEQLTIQYRQEIWYAICYLFVCLLCNTKTSELYACKAPKFWGCTRRHNIHFSRELTESCLAHCHDSVALFTSNFLFT